MNPRAPTPPLSIAPMMQRTDTHFRVLARLLSRHTLLYTEMVTTWAILRGPTDQLLEYDPIEHPISLQAGGMIRNNWPNVPKSPKTVDLMKSTSTWDVPAIESNPGDLVRVSWLVPNAWRKR